MRTATICGVLVSAFADKPAPRELARIVAHWDSDDQAAFFMDLGELLHDCCGFHDVFQIEEIVQSLKRQETELLDGKGSRFIRELGSRVIEQVPA